MHCFLPNDTEMLSVATKIFELYPLVTCVSKNKIRKTSVSLCPSTCEKNVSAYQFLSKAVMLY
jgi:hypothetical protein